MGIGVQDLCWGSISRRAGVDWLRKGENAYRLLDVLLASHLDRSPERGRSEFLPAQRRFPEAVGSLCDQDSVC